MRSARIAILALFVSMLAGAAGGCAHYEYDLVEPRDLTRHISRKADAVAEIDPLTYRLRSVDNRLVLRIYNNTDDSIELLGDKSSVVDPDGQSHPLRSQSIAPKSFIKLIVPPPKPYVYDTSPTFGVGMGYGVRVDATPGPPPEGLPDRREFHTHYPQWEPYFRDEPQYLAASAASAAASFDENDSYYWTWKGSGEARVHLVYRRGDSDLRHDFVFRRVKV
jgi:hypothetical protein